MCNSNSHTYNIHMYNVKKNSSPLVVWCVLIVTDEEPFRCMGACAGACIEKRTHKRTFFMNLIRLKL